MSFDYNQKVQFLLSAFFRVWVLLLSITLAFELHAEDTDNQASPIIININDDFARENIERVLGITDGRIPTSMMNLPRTANYISKNVKAALEALGYYHPEITLEGSPQQWSLSVNTGDAVKWQSFSVVLDGDGKDSSELNQIIRDWPLQRGEPINHGQYDSLKKKLLITAKENGYLAAKFTQSALQIAAKTETADIVWRFDTGKKYHIGQIAYKGSLYTQAFIEKYFPIRPHDAYRQDLVIKGQQQLNRSGYFDYVSIEQSIQHANRQVDLIVNLTDAQRFQLKTELGYSTDSGWNFGLLWNDTRLNDAGHGYGAGFNINQLESAVNLSYRVPLEGIQDQWINRLSYKRKEEPFAISKTTSYESLFINQLDSHWNSQVILNLSEQKIATNSSLEDELLYLVPGWRLTFLSVDDPFRMESGWRWQSDIRLGNRALSDPSFGFIQTEQQIKNVLQLTDKWRLLSRVHIGYTDMDTSEFLNKMPVSYRFFAGGDLSVRGFPYQSLSPLDADNNKTGGKYLLETSLELDWQFHDEWRAAWFVDAGDAFNNYNQMNIQRAAGVGIRWLTPVGSIRLDYARSLSDLNSFRWHFTFGADL